VRVPAKLPCRSRRRALRARDPLIRFPRIHCSRQDIGRARRILRRNRPISLFRSTVPCRGPTRQRPLSRFPPSGRKYTVNRVCDTARGSSQPQLRCW
jgi:hypothetical protein